MVSSVRAKVASWVPGRVPRHAGSESGARARSDAISVRGCPSVIYLSRSSCPKGRDPGISPADTMVVVQAVAGSSPVAHLSGIARFVPASRARRPDRDSDHHVQPALLVLVDGSPIDSGSPASNAPSASAAPRRACSLASRCESSSERPSTHRGRAGDTDDPAAALTRAQRCLRR
jgi:hypothetical protein